MSPSRSGEGVDAIPVITRSSSLKDFTVSREQARLRVHQPPENKKTAAAVHDGYRVNGLYEKTAYSFFFGSGFRDIRDRIEERHQRVNFSPSAGLFGDKDGVTFRLHPGIANTRPSVAATMHQHSSASLRSVVFMAPPSFPALAYPHNNSVGIPASASESRICPTPDGSIPIAPVTQPHEYDAHTPPLPPCQSPTRRTIVMSPQATNPETGTSLFRRPPRFHAPRHGPSPAIAGFPSRQSRTFPHQIIRPPPSIPTVTTSARARISSRLTRLPCCSQKSAPSSGQNAGQDQFPHWHV